MTKTCIYGKHPCKCWIIYLGGFLASTKRLRDQRRLRLQMSLPKWDVEVLTCDSSRMMRKYKDVPQWWYTTMFLIMIGMSLGVCLGYPTAMHWWAFFVSIIIAIVWFVPIGLIQGMTSIQIGLNVFT